MRYILIVLLIISRNLCAMDLKPGKPTLFCLVNNAPSIVLVVAVLQGEHNKPKRYFIQPNDEIIITSPHPKSIGFETVLIYDSMENPIIVASHDFKSKVCSKWSVEQSKILGKLRLKKIW